MSNRTKQMPEPIRSEVLVVLADNERIHTVLAARCPEEAAKELYPGEILALCEQMRRATGFSHYYRIPGGRPEHVEPAFHWETTYRILRRWRKVRGGALREIK